MGQTVHPHACGEHDWDVLEDEAAHGSSPRLWGTRVRIPRAGLVVRFIPTPVGNTSVTFVFIFSFPVHPHACGEHSNH